MYKKLICLRSVLHLLCSSNLHESYTLNCSAFCSAYIIHYNILEGTVSKCAASLLEARSHTNQQQYSQHLTTKRPKPSQHPCSQASCNSLELKLRTGFDTDYFQMCGLFWMPMTLQRQEKTSGISAPHHHLVLKAQTGCSPWSLRFRQLVASETHRQSFLFPLGVGKG